MSAAEPQAPWYVRAWQSHPWMTALTVSCIVAGAVAGALFLPPEWAAARRIAGGAVAGGGIAMCIIGPKLFTHY